MHDYLAAIKHLISEKTGVEPGDITPHSYFEDDLNIAELELAEIITELEEKYQIDLSDDIGNLETVQDLVDLLTERVE